MYKPQLMMALLQYLNFLGGTTALVNLSTNSFCTMERTILHEIVHGLGGKVFEILNSGSLGGSTELEPTQMELFNFLWLIWDHYLPLNPTRKDWHP